ncbi:peptidoglycan recognition family protein [Streptomyces griseoviridis]|uniref:peptidoglycan recognition protein family protein n=1 Tax=Streptomyces griseoviridis TaxID=45398 RepID=UPI0033EA8E53
MADPMTATQVVAQLKKWGIRYVEIPGWSTHNRNQKGAWGPVNGFILHHTGADVANASAKSYAASTLFKGLSDLPGPLCQFSIGADGTVYLVGWGRANHAGGGDPAVLQHVVDEDYTGQLKPTRGNSNGTDGNSRFYGVEIQYSGSHAMADAQYATALRLSAAICDFHGWSEKSVIAHGEWSSDKWDPGYASGKIMNMVGVRSDVARTLATGSTSEEDPMAGITKQDIYDAVWKTDAIAAPKDAPDFKTNPNWQPQSYLKDISARVRAIQAAEAGQTAAIAKLAQLVGSNVDTAAVVSAVQKAIAAAVVKVSVDVTGQQS